MANGDQNAVAGAEDQQQVPGTIKLDAPLAESNPQGQSAAPAAGTIKLDSPLPTMGAQPPAQAAAPTPQRQFVQPTAGKVEQVRYMSPGQGIQEFTKGSTEEQQYLQKFPQAKSVPNHYLRPLQPGEKIESETPQQRSQIEGQDASDAYKDFKARLQEPVKMTEIEHMPGFGATFNPDEVQKMREQGQDTLGSMFGKKRAEEIREHILNGSYVVNVPPEEFAKAALKTLTDWYSPAMLALSVPGRIAHGYAAGADAALKVGDVQKAANLAGKARLAGILGTASGVPFVGKQVASLIDNWDGMSTPERAASIAGILGGSALTGVSMHESGITPGQIKGTAQDVVQTIGNMLPNRGASSPADSMKVAADQMYKMVKPGKKLANDDFKGTLDAAMPQLSMIANQNPDIQNLPDMANRIQQHSDSIDGQLKQKALELRGQPQAIMHGIEDDVMKAMEDGFAGQQRKYNEDEIEAATKTVLKQLGIKYTVETDPDSGIKTPVVDRVAPTPDLFGAENIRQRFKDDTNAAHAAGRGDVPAAEVFAKQLALRAIRESIDDKFTELGVKGVKEWRRQQADLITVKDAIMNAQARSLDEKGNPREWSALNEMAKMKGWGVLPILFGMVHPMAGVAALGAQLGLSKMANNRENPNVLARKATGNLVDAGVSPAVRVPDFGSPTVGQPPATRGEVPPEIAGFGEHENPNQGAAATTSAPEIVHGGERDGINEVKLRLNGQDEGGLYFTHNGDKASVDVSWLSQEHRGKGFGQQLILEAAQRAKSQGANFLTSDSRGETTPAATRVWEVLKEKGYPVENITTANGLPGFQLNLRAMDSAAGAGPQVNHPVVQQLANIADAYQAGEGRAPVNEKKLQVDPRQEQMADAYANATHEPNDPKVVATYDAFKKDIRNQYDRLVKAGFHMDAQPNDPYEGDQLGVGGNQSGAEIAYDALRKDVLDNKHISVWKGGAPPADHPLSEVDPQTGFTYNEMLRMVHDIFGHVLPNNGFDAAGEESAWATHNQMFSPKARPALATETRGQTAYVTKHGEFASQKATILPEEFHHRPEDMGGKESTKDMSMPFWWNDQLHNEVYGGATRGGQLIKDIAQNGGFTIHPRTGMEPTTGYAFEVYPEQRVELDHNPTSEDLRSFMAENRSFLDKNPDLYVGGFNNEQSGKFELDIVGHSNNKAAAMDVARKLDQQSIWDVKGKRHIQTGGKGEVTSFPHYPLEQRTAEMRGEAQVGQPAIEKAPLDKIAAKYGESYDPSKIKDGASFIEPDGKFIHLTPGVTHDMAIDEATGSGSLLSSVDVRPKFLDDSQAVRVRYSNDRGGATTHISVPKQGVTEDQIPAISQAIAQAGRYGNVVMERSDVTPETKDRLSMTQEFPRPSDAAEYLRRIEAHPEQHEVGQPMAKKAVDDNPKGSTIDLLSNPIPRTDQELALFADKVHKGLSLTGTTLADFQKTMGQWVRETSGKISQPSALLKRAINIAANEVNHWVMENGGEGKGWYRKLTSDAIDIMKEKHPALEDPAHQGIFKALWAAHSYGTDPLENMKGADANLTNLETKGSVAYDKGILNPETGQPIKWSGHSGNVYTLAKIQTLIDAHGEAGAVDWLTTKHTWPEMEQEFKDSGLNVHKPGVAFDEDGKTYGANAFGPKGGPFFLNLMGINDHTTVDIWAARALRRWEGRAGDPNTLSKDSKTGLVSDLPPTTDEIKRYHQVATEVGKKLDLDTDDVQALQWYYEHRLYEVHGAGEAARDYKEAARNAVNGTGLPKKGPINALDFINALKGAKAVQPGGNEGAGEAVAGRGANAETRGLFEGDQGSGTEVPQEVGAPEARPMSVSLNQLPRGYTINSVLSHELGHVLEADRVGLPVDDVRSHLHPDLKGSGASAAAWLDFSQFSGKDGKVALKNIAPVFVEKFLPMYLGGGIINNLVDRMPMSENRGVGADINYSVAGLKYLGYTDEQVMDMIHSTSRDMTQRLTGDPALAIIHKYARTREEGLPDTHHFSKERTQEFLNEVKEARRGTKYEQQDTPEPEGNGGGPGRTSEEVVSQPEARRAGTSPKGDLRKGNGEEVSALKPSAGSKMLAGAAAAAGPIIGGLAALAGHKKKEQQPVAAPPEETTTNFKIGNPIGLREPGNINLNNRPVVQNEDGTHSSEYSVSFGTDKGEVLVPTVVNGKFLTPDGKKPPEGSDAEKTMIQSAVKHYEDTGEHLGIFDTPKHADAYADRVHRRDEPARSIPEIVEESARANGIPPEIFRAQIKQESGNKAHVTSNKGAKGAAQLMDPVAHEFGVEDPYDPEQNIPAGARYMSELHRRLGHWDRALAAYNWGADRVKNAVEEHGNEWLEHAPKETQNYVRSILNKK